WIDNRQSLHDTLASYTQDNAWVEFNEDCKGALTPGYMADIAVMDCDLFGADPDELAKARPLATICGGDITFRS
ncbi:MAG: amidohydrolase family protein, partial [Parasphingorhabdus sp.]|uniref:amidohydrolase family protein n=1 Tax=Parasphingorhabdus sp. TaxID=2709688 RepID=UPI00329A1133